MSTRHTHGWTHMKPHLIFEDEVFFIKTYLYAKRISVVNEFLYYYRLNREGSITYLEKENDYVVMVHIYQKEREIFKEVNKYSEYNVLLANRMLFLILARFTQTSPSHRKNFYEVLKEDLIEVLADDEIKNNLSFNVKNGVLKIIESENYEEFLRMDQFKFVSLIVVCHNAESYLDMGINSILNQYFSFESNIQLILVNNGSEDDTDSICSRYSQMYPDNIVYLSFDERMDLDTVHEEAQKYAKGNYTVIFDEPYKLNRDVLSSSVLKINNELEDDLVISIQQFDDLDDTNITHYNFRDLDSSGDNT